MRAAREFALTLDLSKTARVVAELFGSLALTGRGHGTDRAILLGLSGEVPDQVDADQVESKIRAIRESGRIELLGRKSIPFREQTDLVFQATLTMLGHPNTMRFTAFDEWGE